MPSKSARNTQKLVEQEGRLQLAISALNKNQISNIRRAAKVFNVPASTLRDRICSSQHCIEQCANSHKLTQSEEESLVQWILSLD
jgi:hypothetical protein